MLVLSVAANAQNPQITSPTVNPTPGVVHGPVTLSVNFQNNSSLPITNPDPVNGPTMIVFSCSKFTPAGGATPTVTGAGAAYFNWIAIGSGGSWSIIGKQKPGVTISGYTGTPPFAVYAGGPIQLTGTIYSASTPAQATAFNGDGFNANITPGDGGDIENERQQ